MTIRRATPDDFPSIRDLDLGPEITTERDTVYAIFFRLFPELCLIDEDDDGTLAGFALGALASDRLQSYLHDLWVRADRRGVGRGRALLSRYVDESRGLGATRVSLVSRLAGGYYLRLGFRLATADDDPYVPELAAHREMQLLFLDL
jgi:N-acetylglutamate synthase-like GNAT family acetyltransferase